MISWRFTLAWLALFGIAVIPVFAQTETVLIGLTNSWRYNQTVSYDGTNWTAPVFNDSALPNGRGVLALEDTMNPFVIARTNTVLTLGRITYYFRTHFNFSGNPVGVVLTFSNIVDDGAVFYLNGVEVQRLWMTNATSLVTYGTLAAGHEAASNDVFTLSGPVVATNLVVGDNVLAVEVHQTTSGSSDIVFGCALSATTTLTPQPLQMPLEPPQFGYTTVNAFPGLNFGRPLCFASPPGETNRLFVLNQVGQIFVITNLANPTRTTFMTAPGQLFTNSESGLLGMAFHPGYATNRFFFLFFSVTTNSPLGSGLHQRVSRFQTSASNPDQGLPDSELVLINQKDPAGNHNGSDVHFGPDGYLYFTVGDGGVQYDGDYNSQLINSNFFSALCRIDVDSPPRPGSLMPNRHPANTNATSSTPNYRIPADNPFIGRTNYDDLIITNPASLRTEFYAVGFRNPYRFSFDPLTGVIYLGDVGQDRYEEVDIITKGGNYGWSYREGLHVANKADGVTPCRTKTPGEPLIAPIAEYSHGSGTPQGNAVIGGVVYRGTRMSQLVGTYVFGDNVSGNIWTLRYDGTNATPFQRITGRNGLSAFGIDPSNGDILISDVSGGGIYRLIYNTSTNTGIPLPPTLADTGAFTNLTSITNQTQPLTVNNGLVPYDINVHFWSDNAKKSRWFLASPQAKIGFAPDAPWSFPSGMTWVKHFDLEMTNGVPSSARRLETRLLVKNANSVYGVTYRWGNSLTNATLVPDEGTNDVFTINDGGTMRTQVWHYPSRGECLVCHTPTGGFALGFNTAQMNCSFGTNGNQIAAMSTAGYFSNVVNDIHSLRSLAAATNETASREWRVRSYLAANCSQCHQPGGAGLGYWNANITNFTVNAGLIDGVLNNNGGNSNARVIAPGSLSHSMLLTRISTRDAMQMPPLASSVLDTQAIQLVSAWITNELAGGWTNAIDPLLISIHATNAAAAVDFTQPANRAYRVESATNLTPPIGWQFLNVPENRPTFPASNIPVSVPDITNATQKFYRVRVSAP